MSRETDLAPESLAVDKAERLVDARHVVERGTEAVEIFRTLVTPFNLAYCAHSRKEHVFHIGDSGEELGP